MEKYYRLLYPARVSLITSKYKGEDNIMSASWVFPLSADPPMFGVSISPKRHSFNMIKGGEAFAINIPVPGMERAIEICGTGTGKGTDRFADAGLTREEGQNVPLIKECAASIECKLVNQIKTGDHTIFIGNAINIVKRKESKGIYQSKDGFISV